MSTLFFVFFCGTLEKSVFFSPAAQREGGFNRIFGGVFECFAQLPCFYFPKIPAKRRFLEKRLTWAAEVLQ